MKRDFHRKGESWRRGLRGFHLAYASSYAGTSVGLNLADPGKKLQAVVGNVKLAEGGEKIKKVIASMNPAIQVAKKLGFSAEKLKRYEDRMNLMDDHMAKEYVNNPELYAKNFEVGGKYNNLKEVDIFGTTVALKSVDGKIRFPNGNSLRGELFNYVLLKEGSDYRLVFGENHSYLSQGKNVEYAGSIQFTQSGNIKYMDNGSGHYLPDFNDLEGKNNVLKAMKGRFGIDLDMSIFQPYKK